MEIIPTEIILHTVGGREYEIRCRKTAEGWEAATFYHGKQLGPVYRASMQPGTDPRHYDAKSVVEGLVRIAKSDLDAWNVKCF
jgi:hypothetical protein